MQFDRFPECLFRSVPPPATQFQRSEVGIRAASVLGDLDRFLDLVHRSVEMLQAGERVGDEDLRIEVARVFFQDLLGTGLCVIESTCEEQQVPGV